MGIIPHRTGVVNGRIECTFSRVISVVSEEEGSDFNLDNPYYIIIGTGEQQGIHEIVYNYKTIVYFSIVRSTFCKT